MKSLLKTVVSVFIISAVLLTAIPFVRAGGVFSQNVARAAASDPIVDIYKAVTSGWNDLGIDYWNSSLKSIGKRLKNREWKIYNPNTGSWTRDQVYTQYNGSQMTAGYFVGDWAYIMDFSYWGGSSSNQLQITTGYNKEWMRESRDGVKGFLPKKVVNLLGCKGFDDLGLTESVIRNLKSRGTVSSGNRDLFWINGYGSGIDFVEIYSNGTNIILSFSTYNMNFKLSGYHDAITSLFVEFLPW